MFKNLKKFLIVALVLVMSLSTSTLVFADSPHKSTSSVYNISKSAPVIFESDVVVPEKGGKFTIGENGFVTFDFPANFIDKSDLPKALNIKVYAIDGEVGAMVEPSIEEFNKDVTVRVKSYKGPLYDEALGKNIMVDIDPVKVIVHHFSWFKFR